MPEPSKSEDESDLLSEETIFEEALREAKGGNLSNIANLLSGRALVAYSPQEHQDFIRNCIAECAKLGMPQLLEALFQEMLVFDAAILLRAQALALYKMRMADSRSGPTVSPLPPQAVEEIERVGRIEERIVYLGQSYSKFQRTMGLGQRRARGGGQVLRMADYHSACDDAPASGSD